VRGDRAVPGGLPGYNRRMSAADTLRRALEPVPAVRLAVMFGSAASGSDRPDSDLDVGVSLTRADVDLSALTVALERATGRVVDLVALDTAPPLLRFEVARQGVLLVEREPHAWAEFRARAMIDWWDWAPTARMAHRVMAARLREEAQGGAP
jgi:predicted nucleotidyltransferase